MKDQHRRRITLTSISPLLDNSEQILANTERKITRIDERSKFDMGRNM